MLTQTMISILVGVTAFIVVFGSLQQVMAEAWPVPLCFALLAGMFAADLLDAWRNREWGRGRQEKAAECEEQSDK